ncbi:MAG: transposase [Verrucomicrobia bacterium]|nr:transposase [Verrucomicrobiota bacterium]
MSVPGFRTEEVELVTTLLDEELYPDAAIAALYRRRWEVELCFRDIKTTLGLDVLRCGARSWSRRKSGCRSSPTISSARSCSKPPGRTTANSRA